MIERSLPAGPNHLVRVRCSDRHDGDFHVDAPPGELARRRQKMVAGEWTWLRQIHGATVVEVTAPGHRAGEEADGSVTSVPGAVLSVQSADCAPVVVAGSGVVAVAHAGWRGLTDGVIPAAVAAVRARADGPLLALLGPCIHPGGYAFGAAELAQVAAVVGDVVRAKTVDGDIALDLPAGVRASLQAAGVDELHDLSFDTAACGWFSHRTRADSARQVTVAWLEEVR